MDMEIWNVSPVFRKVFSIIWHTTLIWNFFYSDRWSRAGLRARRYESARRPTLLSVYLTQMHSGIEPKEFNVKQLPVW